MEIKGCIFPRCEGGLKCPLAEPPEFCKLDSGKFYNEEIIELEKKVIEGKEAAKRIAEIRRREYFRRWYEDHKQERRKYMLQRYYEKKKGTTS